MKHFQLSCLETGLSELVDLPVPFSLESSFKLPEDSSGFFALFSLSFIVSVFPDTMS